MIDFLAANAGVIGLLFFFTFFIVVFIYLYRPSQKGKYQNQAEIPLKEMGHE